MRVKATADGYYGGLVRKFGDAFVINDGDALGKWMTALDPPPVPVVTEKEPSKKQ